MREPDGAHDRLEDILAVTDSALDRLDVEHLLVELLERVRSILGADTSAVLLLDEGANALVARAARGIEEEVHQGVHVPVGRGFAGRIATERGPVFLDRVDHTTVANPILWEKGIRAMLGVPLLSGDRVMGVLHVGTLGDRRFTQEDGELLRLVAERVSAAVQARQLEIERSAATILERSLLPPALPRLPGLELAARYVTAEGRGVGGDWYDVFTLPSGELWVVTGDVAGHGLHAAVIMGRIRSTLRAYALQGGSPAEVLALTDRKLQHFEPAEMATVVCVTATPPFDTLRISSAGHLPPVLATGEGVAALVGVDSDAPLGAALDLARTETTVDFPRGSVVLLYTDGLVERRGEALDSGLEKLQATVTAEAAGAVCQSVMHELVGHTVPQDDIAIIAARRVGDQDPRAAPAPGHRSP